MPRISPLLIFVLAAAAAQAQTFTCGPAKHGATALTSATLVTDTAAGWDLHPAPTVANGICSSTGDKQPFYFSIPLPEGSYRVTTVLGGKEASVITIRSEVRRLMIENLPIAAGKTVTKTFDVNTRLADYIKPDGTPGKVALMRGRTILDWDKVAAATKTALIDLNAMSKTFFETLGHPGSDKAFMHIPANSYQNQSAAINDNTHFNEYGAYELARCIVHGIREDKLPIAKFLDPTVPDFDPAHPDPVDKFSLPITPLHTPQDVAKVPQT